MRILKKKEFLGMIRIHLRELMAKKDWTQRDVSRRTGLRPNLVMELYHGLVKSIKPSTLDALCELFNCQPGDLMTYEPAKPKSQKPNKS